MSRSRIFAGTMVGHFASGLAAIATLALWPPADGAMLVVPLTGQGTADLLNLALAHDARLIGVGPVAGSIVVRARRAGFAADALADGQLVIAANPIWCGKGRAAS